MRGTRQTIAPEEAGCPARFRRSRQPGDGVGAFFRGAQPGAHLLVKGRQRLLQAGCVHPSGVHGMDADTACGQLFRPQLRQHHQPPLGPGIGFGAVVSAPGGIQIIQIDPAGIHAAGGDIDDTGHPARGERRTQPFGQQEGA